MARKSAKRGGGTAKKRTKARSVRTASAQPGQAEQAPRRYVVSQLMSLHPTLQLQKDALEVFSNRVEKVLFAGADVASDNTRDGSAGETPRRVVVIEADPAEIRAKASELTADTVIEPELLRVPAIAYPAELTTAGNTQGSTNPGTGASLNLTLLGPDGEHVPSCKVVVRFNGNQDPTASIIAGGVSGANGAVTVPFDPNLWRPTLLIAEPAGRYWSTYARMPQPGQTIRLSELPRTGPNSWWHLLAGAVAYEADAGQGIKVGVIDSGVGPHPNLAHAVPIGAFLDGGFQPGENKGRDVQTHGTHVSGIIGARPAPESGAYGGIAPGAELFVARIFTADGGGNQGDVANALDVLSGQHAADIINMSSTGAPSSIEHDAVILAARKGALCICAAGNQNGAGVGYPGAYPEAVAVSAFGLANAVPADSLPNLNVPTRPDMFGYGGIYLASFSNIGQQIFCGAPGNGIISTIPSNPRGEGAICRYVRHLDGRAARGRHLGQSPRTGFGLQGFGSEHRAKHICESGPCAACGFDQPQRGLPRARAGADGVTGFVPRCTLLACTAPRRFDLPGGE